MPRTVRDAKIETRAARARLPAQGKPHWRAIGQGLHLGYRRNRLDGKWVVRVYLGHQNYATETIGLADDAIEADGAIVRNWTQAQAFARGRFIALRRQAAGLPAARVATVGGVLDAHAAAQGAAGKGVGDLRWRIEAIRRDLGDMPITELTTATLQSWRDGIVAKRQPRVAEEDTYEGARKARASANRQWFVLTAALNHAHRSGVIADDGPWRRVRSLPVATAARERFLSADEAKRLINACSGAFRTLVQVALVSGARYGELARLRVQDFSFDSATLYIARSKSGKSRHIHLTDEARELLAQITAGRSGSDLLLRKDGGSNWRKSHQLDPMIAACKRANIDPPIGFHGLRHTYCSLSVMNGVPLQVVARNAGHATVAITEKHYAHLAPSYIADEVRRKGPRFDIAPSNVAAIRR
jgi:integrase